MNDVNKKEPDTSVAFAAVASGVIAGFFIGEPALMNTLKLLGGGASVPAKEYMFQIVGGGIGGAVAFDIMSSKSQKAFVSGVCVMMALAMFVDVRQNPQEFSKLLEDLVENNYTQFVQEQGDVNGRKLSIK